MRRSHLVASFVALLLACGGSTGFQQPAPRAADISGAPQVVNDSEVERAFALRAQLPKPYRLGVLFRDPPPSAEPGEPEPWRWQVEHRAQLVAALETQQDKGELGAVLSIARSTVTGDDLRAYRIAAARQGADAVLVVSGSDRVERDSNAWAATYFAIVPMLFAPGSELRVDFATHAELWDVRNEYLYLAAEAEARAEQKRAFPYLDREAASAEAQRASLSLLAEELKKRFARLHGAS
jgi:hypothetical protein